MTTIWQSRCRLAITCGVIATVLFALAACTSTPKVSSLPQATAQPTATALRMPTATATVTLAARRSEWTNVATSPSNAVMFAFAPSNPHIGVLCTRVGSLSPANQPKLYKTADSGMSWQEVANVPALQLTSATPYPPVTSCTAFIDASDANDILVQKVAFSLTSPSHAIARTLYRSRDGGATWGPPLATVANTDGFDNLAFVGKRLVATVHPSVISFSGCSDAQPLPPEQPSTILYTSDDDGQSWQPIGQPIEDQHLKVVGMSLMDNNIFAFAHTLRPAGCVTNFQPTTSLWKSDDGGRTWQQVTLPTSGPDRLRFTARADGNGYYGVGLVPAPSTSQGVPDTVLFSADSGATWTALQGPAPVLKNNTPPLTMIWYILTVSPSGVIAADVLQNPLGGGPVGVYLLRPSDPTPAWSYFAQGVTYGFETQTFLSGATIWALDLPEIPPVLKEMTLP